MSTDVIMPQMGESIFEGTITKWLKKAGDSVEKDEPLFEISTDKVDAEIPSPVAGVLTEIKIGEGATVEVNTVVAVIDGAASPAAAAAHAPKANATQATVQQAPVQPPAPKANQSPTDVEVEVVMPQLGESIFEGTITKWLKKVGDAVQADQPLFEISTDKVDAEIPAPISGVLTAILAVEGETVQVNTVVAKIGSGAAIPQTPPAQSSAAHSSAPAAAGPQAAQSQAAVQKGAPLQMGTGGRIRSSPLARRIAKEHGVDLSRIAGTGSAGRVSKEDVLRAVNSPAARTSVQESAPLQVVPLTRMRAIIAERMVESKRVSPHVHTVYKIDMTRVVQHRAANMVAFEQRRGAKLTYMPYIAVAVIAALKKYPVVNASFASGSGSGGASANGSTGPGIRYHQNINLGIAVALDWGLIVPVVRQAEQRSFAEIARAVGDLAGRARTKKLTPDEVGGSTFSLTNSGIFGDEFSTPIINQPESAILCISGLKKEPAVVTDAQGNDTIAIRSMQHFTLGFDHRLIDGADACKFMLELKRGLESWDQEIN
jgi:pyruvate dehydrogenase E2 component (dihydrolipoamide acetyltransferase)